MFLRVQRRACSEWGELSTATAISLLPPAAAAGSSSSLSFEEDLWRGLCRTTTFEGEGRAAAGGIVW